MKDKDYSLGISLVIVSTTLILLKGFAFQYLWNSFLIDWAKLQLPTIGFWYSVLITILISLVTNGSVNSNSKN